MDATPFLTIGYEIQTNIRMGAATPRMRLCYEKKPYWYSYPDDIQEDNYLKKQTGEIEWVSAEYLKLWDKANVFAFCKFEKYQEVEIFVGIRKFHEWILPQIQVEHNFNNPFYYADIQINTAVDLGDSWTIETDKNVKSTFRFSKNTVDNIGFSPQINFGFDDNTLWQFFLRKYWNALGYEAGENLTTDKAHKIYYKTEVSTFITFFEIEKLRLFIGSLCQFHTRKLFKDRFRVMHRTRLRNIVKFEEKAHFNPIEAVEAIVSYLEQCGVPINNIPHYPQKGDVALGKVFNQTLSSIATYIASLISLESVQKEALALQNVLGDNYSVNQDGFFYDPQNVPKTKWCLSNSDFLSTIPYSGFEPGGLENEFLYNMKKTTRDWKEADANKQKFILEWRGCAEAYAEFNKKRYQSKKACGFDTAAIKWLLTQSNPLS